MFYQNWFNYSMLSDSGNLYSQLSLNNFTREDLIEQIDSVIELIEDKDIFLMFSGGSDSYVILSRLLYNNVKFTAVIVEYPNPTEDILFAKKYVVDNNISHLVIEYDPQHIISDYTWYAKKFNGLFSVSEIVYLCCRQMLPQSACVIRGEGDPRIFRYKENLYAQFKKTTFCTLQSLLHSQEIFNDIPLFYMYTKELYESYINDYSVRIALNNALVKSLENQKSKIFSRYGINLPCIKKYTGFENYDTKQLAFYGTELVQEGYNIPYDK